MFPESSELMTECHVDPRFGLVYSPYTQPGLWLLILILSSKEIGIFEVSTDVRLRHKINGKMLFDIYYDV